MQLNTVAAVTVACVTVIPWISHQADNLVNEAPTSWLNSARSMASISSMASKAWFEAANDGVVTMDEVRSIQSAYLVDDKKLWALERAAFLKNRRQFKSTADSGSAMY